MKTKYALMLLAVTLLSGCSQPASSSGSSGSAIPTSRTYNGTASVGDFLTITIDSVAHTVTYTNKSNGDAGTIPYTSNSDGTYALNDPTSNLLAAYEVPGYALLIEAAKVGPAHNTMSLITAIETGPISTSTFAGKTLNYMQFRTAAGGVSIGSVSMDAQGTLQHKDFWPYGAQSQPPDPFQGGSFPASSFVQDASGTFLRLTESNASVDYLFGTANGLFAVDSGNGAILGMPQGANSAFDPTNFGTYKAIFYQKTNSQTGMGNVESGTPSLGNATVTITSTGALTITDSASNVLAAGSLTPVAAASYLYDGTSNELASPCNGLFTVRITTTNSQQDVFMGFQGNTIIFSSYESALPFAQGNPYNYFYGVGLK
jgi:hypothetical protein